MYILLYLDSLFDILFLDTNSILFFNSCMKKVKRKVDYIL